MNSEHWLRACTAVTLVPALALASVLATPAAARAAPAEEAPTVDAPDTDASDPPASEGDAAEPPSAPADPAPSVADPDPAPADGEAAADPEPETEPAPETETESEPDGKNETPIEGPQDDLSDARAAFAKGAKHYELGDYEPAIDIFERLYRQTSEPRLLFNLGQAYWKRFNIDPDVAHLRTARTMFENYDKAMAAKDRNYDPREAQANIKVIEAQIQGIEASQQQTSLEPMGPTPEMLEYDRKRRTNSGLSKTGVLFIVLGTLSGLGAGVFAIVRSSTKIQLDQASGKQSNPFSADEYEQLRKTYLLSGQITFGTAIGAAVFLPIGITLTAIGVNNNRKLTREGRYALTPTASGLKLRF